MKKQLTLQYLLFLLMGTIMRLRSRYNVTKSLNILKKEGSTDARLDKNKLRSEHFLVHVMYIYGVKIIPLKMVCILICTDILACKLMYKQDSQFLFGQNTFLGLNRKACIQRHEEHITYIGLYKYNQDKE